MTAIRALIARRPVVVYYVLTFGLSWGGFLLVGWSGLRTGTGWEDDPRFWYAVLAMVAGPTVAGLLLTVLGWGARGLRELLDRLSRWRASPRWYSVALLIAPLVQAGVLFALTPLGPGYLPSIITAPDTVSLLVLGIAAGLGGALIEELGWTGFAIPRMWRRYGVLATGLVVGVLWGAWHLLQMLWVGNTSAGDVPPVLFMAQYLFTAIAALAAYRVLMVWVYAATESLLLAVLMHASYIFSTLIVLAPPTIGLPYLIYSWTFAIVLWALVAVVVLGAPVRCERRRHRPTPTPEALAIAPRLTDLV
jgi:membrane protease YdiL (CAAX protease family)